MIGINIEWMKKETANTPNESATCEVNKGTFYTSPRLLFMFITPNTNMYKMNVKIARMPNEPALMNSFKSFNINTQANHTNNKIPAY
jgi:hypothetical protein